MDSDEGVWADLISECIPLDIEVVVAAAAAEEEEEVVVVLRQ